jgi:hypothetical protein
VADRDSNSSVLYCYGGIPSISNICVTLLLAGPENEIPITEQSDSFVQSLSWEINSINMEQNLTMEPDVLMWSCLSGEILFVHCVMRSITLNPILIACFCGIPVDIIIPHEQVYKCSLPLYLHANILHTRHVSPWMLQVASIWRLCYLSLLQYQFELIIM